MRSNKMRRDLRFKTKWLAVTLSYLLLLQLVTTPVVAQAPLPEKLNIVVLEGEGAVNNIRQRTAREPIVQVEDQNRRPIAGATVVFTLPTAGPSGEFANGAKTTTILTDDQGKAAARGLKINKVSGKLLVHVNASYRGLTASTTITQFNMDVPGASKGGGSGKVITILAVVGAAAAGGAALALRKNGSSSTVTPAPLPNVPISITPGTGTIGPPH